MKIRANIKYPPPKFETRDLTFKEARKLVDALTKELVVTNRQLGGCEGLLERCRDYLERRDACAPLLAEIKDALK